MRRSDGVDTGSVINLAVPNYAAKTPCTVVVTSWHPPAYFEWDAVPKTLRSMRHWAVSAGAGDTPSAWVYPSAIDLCGAGFMQQVRWKDLEPTLGVYDFTAITNALNWLQANKPSTKMFIRLLDKSYLSSNSATDFSTDTQVRLPAYFAGHVYHVYQGSTASGFGPMVWETWVKDRFIALVTAMATAFGAHPSFAGICFDESTLSMVFPPPAEFSVVDNLSNRKAILSAAVSLFQGKTIMQPINYFDGGDGGSTQFSTSIDDFTTWCMSNGVQISLVDTVPTKNSFMYPMSSVLRTHAPAFAIVDAGRVYPRTDMSAGVEQTNVTGNFTDIKNWLLVYENITDVFWPIANNNTFAALQTVLA